MAGLRKRVGSRVVWAGSFVLLALYGWVTFSLWPVKEVSIRSLEGRVIVVDPGHGGVDPGASGREGVLEKEVVLDIGLRLRDLLEQSGAYVVMTRTTDTDLSGYNGPGRYSERKKIDLKERVKLADEAGADIFLSLHANAIGSSRWRGAQVFFQSADSKFLAEKIQESLVRITGNTDRKASQKIDQYVLREVKARAVNVEVGFLSNPSEESLLASPEYRQRLAWAIFLGLADYFSELPVGGK